MHNLIVFIALQRDGVQEFEDFSLNSHTAPAYRLTLIPGWLFLMSCSMGGRRLKTEDANVEASTNELVKKFMHQSSKLHLSHVTSSNLTLALTIT